MKLREQNVLFFTRAMGLGGTENVILQLCEIFKESVNKIVVCSCGGVNVGKLDQMGIRHYTIPDIESKYLGNMLATARILKQIIAEEQITTIHTHHRMAAFYVSLLRLYKKQIFVNTSHNTFHNKKFLTRFAYRHGRLIACGEMVKKNLVEEFGLPEKQVTVIYNAIKPFSRTVIPEPKIEALHKEGKIVIGNVGRLSKQKGMEYFIKAIPQIVSRCPKARFVIVGDGEEAHSLKELAEKLQIQNYLEFLGYRNDVQNILSQIDFVVLSSLWEGLPLTPIEAFSVSKTVVATAVDGTLEIINDEVNGFLIPPADVKRLAEKCIWLIEHPEVMNKAEKAAKDRYLAEFSFDRLKDSYIQFYKNCT